MNVLKNLKLDLSYIKSDDQKKLVKIISRISEASYRRGVQQGQEAIEAVHSIAGKDLHKFRYEVSLDKKFFGMTPVDRLYAEYDDSLDDIGLYKHELFES